MSYYQTQYVNIKGDRGERGPHGVQGPPGYDGHPGPRGEVGPEGPIGPRGFEGPRGLQGIIGNDGPIGPKGSKGEIGIQGIQGNIGSTGTTGTTGPHGPRGIQGRVGLNGQKGDNLNIKWVGNFLKDNTTNTNYINISGETIKGLYLLDNDLSNKLDSIKNVNNETIIILNTEDSNQIAFSQHIENTALPPGNNKTFEDKVFYIGDTQNNILGGKTNSKKIDTSGTNLLGNNHVDFKNHLISLTYDSNLDVYKPYLMNQAGAFNTTQLEQKYETLKTNFNSLLNLLENKNIITNQENTDRQIN